jgi:creatinine amidohydrolase
VSAEDTVRLELRLPSEIRAALAMRSVVYVPLGTYEWHGEHLPIGLDALTAHGLCIDAALRDGGLVCPPLYYGVGGAHENYPWTIMLDESEIAPLLAATLHRLQTSGVETVVLMSGHFATEQLAMIETIADSWKTCERSLRVLALAVSQSGIALAPDHAAVFETTLLNSFWPDRVRVDLLPPIDSEGPLDPGGDTMGPQRHDPMHPLFGIFGPDPRRFDPQTSQPLRDALVQWLVDRVRDRTHTL